MNQKPECYLPLVYVYKSYFHIAVPYNFFNRNNLCSLPKGSLTSKMTNVLTTLSPTKAFLKSPILPNCKVKLTAHKWVTCLVSHPTNLTNHWPSCIIIDGKWPLLTDKSKTRLSDFNHSVHYHIISGYISPSAKWYFNSNSAPVQWVSISQKNDTRVKNPSGIYLPQKW